MIALNHEYTMTSNPSTFIPTPILTHLGEQNIADFLKNDWHVRPRLFRQALKHMPSLTIEDILPLASDEDVESRLITCFDGQWDMQHGPFKRLPAKTKKNWTVLIQGLNLHLPQANQLLEQFRFVPDARLDDVMVSVASDGGGVGPHFDSYDVFLLQLHGKRHWRIGQQSDLSLEDDLPLKILKQFEPTEEWILEPGDMLYLPPHYAHDGVAVGQCATLSIGFRAPKAAEMMSAVLRHWSEQVLCDEQLNATRFKDAGRGELGDQNPAQMPSDMVRFVENLFRDHPPESSVIAQGLAQSMTEPKDSVFFDSPEKPLTEKFFVKKLIQIGCSLDAKTRLMCTRNDAYINGEQVIFENNSMAQCIQQIAKQRGLEPDACSMYTKDVAVQTWLYDMYNAGWIRLGNDAV